MPKDIQKNLHGVFKPDKDFLVVYWDRHDKKLYTHPIMGFTCWEVEHTFQGKKRKSAEFHPILLTDSLGLSEEKRVTIEESFIGITWKEDFEENKEYWIKRAKRKMKQSEEK